MGIILMMVKIIAGLFWALLYPAACLAAFWGQAAAQSPVTLYTVPSPITLSPGQVGTIDVWVGNASNVSSYTVVLDFDPRMVQVLDGDPNLAGVQARPGNFFTTAPTHTSVNLVDNTYGRLIYAISLLNPAAPLSGNGILISFELQATGSGASTLNLSQSTLLSPDGHSLSMTIQNPQVSIGVTPTPTTPIVPSSTETATATSLPTATFTVAATLPVAATAGNSPVTGPPNIFLPIVVNDLHSPEAVILPVATDTLAPATATPTISPTPSPQPSTTPLPPTDTPVPTAISPQRTGIRTTAWAAVIVVIAGVLIAVGAILYRKRSM